MAVWVHAFFWDDLTRGEKFGVKYLKYWYRVAKHTDCGFTKNKQLQRYTNEGLHW